MSKLVRIVGDCGQAALKNTSKTLIFPQFSGIHFKECSNWYNLSFPAVHTVFFEDCSPIFMRTFQHYTKPRILASNVKVNGIPNIATGLIYKDIVNQDYYTSVERFSATNIIH